MLLVHLAYSRHGWCSVAGMWHLCRSLKVLKCSIDSAPVRVGTPIALLEDQELEKVYEILHDVEYYTSVASIVSLCKRELGKKRVFLKLSAIGKPDEDRVKACACGGCDGIVPVPRIDTKELYGISVINIYDETQPHYIYRTVFDIAEIKNAQKKVYGVIVEFYEKPSLSTILNLREYVFRHVGPVDLIVGAPHLVFTQEFLRKIRDFVNGVMITSTGNIIMLDVATTDKEVHVARCASCRVDFVSKDFLKKCPYCSEKLTELLKQPTERMLSYTARELRFISNEFLASYDPGKFRIEVR